ncbi:hypothetical protein DUNSADRAFT_18114 [Dunaliella salina]|uniref:C3H1-type domain-containing protein n=1 Tax=Dunaliella salina TaxID=3046 RepID=A0ABQ7G0L7_DUNSA|nr:hypothetical protein DUNSADRAFT_18114 [Dunaliella salina]|eukprot:KAF5828151.1 hypothetical protein DUNSADRAFT_18114 [Dunaliella salina]
MYASNSLGGPTPSYLRDPAYGSLKQDMVGAHNAYPLFPLEMEAAMSQERGMALPPFVGTTSETCFTPAELAHYSTDEFRMFAFKVFRCTKRFAHDWRTCPFAHPTENARRRDPNVYRYSAIACPDYKQGFCMRGELCPYAHGVFECWLHPSRYRTQLCKDGTACSRPLCFFAHSLPELRAPTHTWTPNEEDPQLPQAPTFPEQSSTGNNHPSVAQSPGSPSQSLVQVAAQLATVSMGREGGDDSKVGPSDLMGLAPGSPTTPGGHIRAHRHKPHHHHHHHHHHHGVQRSGSSNSGAASALGLTAPRMSNAFARRHGLNPKDNAMLNLQKIAIQAQLANTGGAATTMAPSGTEVLAARGSNHAHTQLMKGGLGSCASSSRPHHHHHQQRMDRLFSSSSSSSGLDSSSQQQQQQHTHHGGAGKKGSSTLNHVAAAAANAAVSVPSATPASTSTAAAVAAVAAVAGASDGSGALSSNHSGTSSNHSSSHNSSMHLSNLSADSSGPISGSASGNSNGNSSSPLGLLSTPPASTTAATNSAYLPQRDAASPYLHASPGGSSSGGKGRRPATAHFMAAGTAPTPPLMHFQAAMNNGSGGSSVAPCGSAAAGNRAGAARTAQSNSTGTNSRSGGGHGGMMLPLAWPVMGAGNTASSAHADAATLAALQQHLEAFSFQPAHSLAGQQRQQQVAMGPMGMANFAGGTNGGAAMGLLTPQQQQQQSQQQLLEEYMHSMQGMQN